MQGQGRWDPPSPHPPFLFILKSALMMEVANSKSRAEQELDNCVSMGEKTEEMSDLLLIRKNECLEMPRKSIPEIGAAVASTIGVDGFAIVGTLVKHKNKLLDNGGERTVWLQERQGDIFSDIDSGERISHILNATMCRSPVASDKN